MHANTTENMTLKIVSMFISLLHVYSAFNGLVVPLKLSWDDVFEAKGFSVCSTCVHLSIFISGKPQVWQSRGFGFSPKHLAGSEVSGGVKHSPGVFHRSDLNSEHQEVNAFKLTAKAIRSAQNCRCAVAARSNGPPASFRLGFFQRLLEGAVQLVHQPHGAPFVEPVEGCSKGM